MPDRRLVVNPGKFLSGGTNDRALLVYGIAAVGRQRSLACDREWTDK